MLRFLLVVALVALLAAWWLGYLPGRSTVGADYTVDPGAARQRGAEVAGRVADGINKATQGVDDAALTAKIKSKMALDDLVRARNIDVDTVQGDVTLTGTVASTEERDRAVRLAKETVGVRTVVDRLQLAR